MGQKVTNQHDMYVLWVINFKFAVKTLIQSIPLKTEMTHKKIQVWQFDLP
jgi:hypothetical protein